MCPSNQVVTFLQRSWFASTMAFLAVNISQVFPEEYLRRFPSGRVGCGPALTSWRPVYSSGISSWEQNYHRVRHGRIRGLQAMASRTSTGVFQGQLASSGIQDQDKEPRTSRTSTKIRGRSASNKNKVIDQGRGRRSLFFNAFRDRVT